MKKGKAAAYLCVGVMVGAILGSALSAWAGFGRSSRIAFGQYQIGMFFENENSALVQIYQPKKIKKVEKLGSRQVRIILE